MDQFIHRIIERYPELFEPEKQPLTVSRVDVGFSNTLFCVNDHYMVKICADPEKEYDLQKMADPVHEAEFRREIDFYLQNCDDPLITKLWAYDLSKEIVPWFYEVYEKIEGVTLYNVWHLLPEERRRDVIGQICGAMQQFHKVKGELYDWVAFIRNDFQRSYTQACEKGFWSLEEQKIIDAAASFYEELLASDDFVLVHNDLHFDNIIYKDGQIRLIDFERSMIAPPDYELDIFYRMVRYPLLFASEEEEKLVMPQHYAHIMEYAEEFYPELFAVPHLYERLALYEMDYIMDQFLRHPEIPRLRNTIMQAAKLVVRQMFLYSDE